MESPACWYALKKNSRIKKSKAVKAHNKYLYSAFTTSTFNVLPMEDIDTSTVHVVKSETDVHNIF